VALHLGHKIHYHDNHDQQRGTTQVKGYVPHHHQELRHQANQRNIRRAEDRQPGQHAINVIGSLLKRSGAFIPGYRPGEQTAKYIDNVMSRLTLAGAIYITAVCLLPEFLIVGWNVPFYFGGTSLLIIVVVVMDFMAQIQAHMMSHQYEGLMKKANLKGGGAGLLR